MLRGLGGTIKRLEGGGGVRGDLDRVASIGVRPQRKVELHAQDPGSKMWGCGRHKHADKHTHTHTHTHKHTQTHTNTQDENKQSGHTHTYIHTHTHAPEHTCAHSLPGEFLRAHTRDPDI